MTKYLIRLDDACPYMNKEKWQRMESILDTYGIKPLVGIIPANADPKTMIEPEDSNFWNKVQQWIGKKWEMALHGYDHVCISDGGMNGLNPFWKRSEFAGLSLEQQKEKIRKGNEVLLSKGIHTKYFFAPSHTFDQSTLKALEDETDIRIISDTIALKPYKSGNFTFISQISGHCVKMPISGVYTFCFHPNTMKDKDFGALDSFLSDNKDSFISFSDIEMSKVGTLAMKDRIVRTCFFALRKLKGLK